MKALALDTAIGKITIAAKNEENCVTQVLDIGMRQSEALLPAVMEVMRRADVEASDLDAISISRGPGSFTGLRLGYACAKALAMATEKPLFSYSTLDVYAEPFQNLPFVVAVAIDAHKEKFYFKAFEDGNEIFPETDIAEEKIAVFLNAHESKKDILLCGPDCEKLRKMLCASGVKKTMFTAPFWNCPTDALFKFTQKDFDAGKKGMEDYEGPEYLRLSEAEEKTNAPQPIS